MKFELKPNNRNAPDNELIDDIKRVKLSLGLNSLSQKDYREHGRFSCDTLTRRFGTWADVLEKAGLEVENYHYISNDGRNWRSEIISDFIDNAWRTYSLPRVMQ